MSCCCGCAALIRHSSWTGNWAAGHEGQSPSGLQRTGRTAELHGDKLGFPRSRCRAVVSDVLTCVHIYILYVCVYICVCRYACGHVYIYIYVHVCMYMNMYAFIHTCMCMCMLDTLRHCYQDFLYVHTCAYVCLCICVCMWAHFVYLYCPISLLHARVSQMFHNTCMRGCGRIGSGVFFNLLIVSAC